jgi:HEAT repeat protein
LLLTIITLIHRYQAELPRQRCKLYEKAVETLLTSWDSGKEIKLYSQVLLFLKSDDLLYILKKLAYWIHTQGSTGETEGGTLIDKDELIQQLRAEIQKITGCKTHEAKAEAERFVDFIQKRTGLLNEQGRDRYAFVHKTFQEYLTAEEIYEIDESGEDTKIIGKHFREHLHDQHWREVLLLLVSKLKGKKAQNAIQTVLVAESEYEQWLHRDLLFAGWCLTEDPSRLTVVAKDFVGGILDRLVDLEVENVDQIGSKISDEVRKILHCLGETTLEQVLLKKLQAEGDRIDRFRLLEFQAALGQETEAIDKLLSLLQEEDSDIRSRAIHLAYSMNNQKVVSGVFSLLGDEDGLVGLYASSFLRHCGNTNQELVNNLLSSLHDKNSNIRFRAVEALRQLENISENVVFSLIPLLRDESPKVRYRVIEALGHLENPSEEIVNGLRSLLSDKDLGVQSRVVEALSRLENPSEEVLNISMSLLRDGDFSIRWRVQASLIREHANPKVIKFLKSLLEDENSKVRQNGLEVLGRLENPVEEIVSYLIFLLEDKNSNVRQNVATTLIQWGNTSSEVVNTLLFLLKDESSNIRLSAASTLIHQLGNSSPKVINTLLSLIEDCDSNVRLNAGYTLVHLGDGSPAMIDFWLSSLGNRDLNIRSNSVQVLSGLAKTSDTICPKVLQWLEQNPNNGRIGSAIDCLWSIVVE